VTFLSRHAAWLAALLSVGYLGLWAMPRPVAAGRPNLDAFAGIPVQEGGRVKPIGTFAVTTLTTINSRQNFVHSTGQDEKSHPPIEWLLDVWGEEPFRGPAADYPVFRITDLQLVEYFKLPQRIGFWRYSPAELRPQYEKFETDVARLQQQRKADASKLSAFDNNMLELGKHVSMYLALCQRADPQSVPPQGDNQSWQTVIQFERDAAKPFETDVQARAVYAALQKIKPGAKIDDLKKLNEDETNRVRAEAFDLYRDMMTEVGEHHLKGVSPAAAAFSNLFKLYRAGKYDDFNAAVADYKATYLAHVPADVLGRERFETFLNRASPTYHAMILYVLAFVCACVSWVLAGLGLDSSAGTLRRVALGMVAATAVVHFGILIGRMYLMDRWLVFVTNLYSSAVFIGWACAALGLFVEAVFGRGLGTAVAAVIGGATLIIAYFLGYDGDTLTTLQAVLDTNFWLATHVTTVTLGYSATYFAGIFGLAYVLTGVLTPYLSGDLRKSLAQVTYGVVCFATFLSFTGTVLGGIWADQSWGRFWGWDPKENGALLIVIWNALVLHARWSGLVKQRGVAVLTIFGCVVTTWSWFGTNQLGVGLHSYGFTTGRTIAIICASSVFTALGCLGMIPTRYWRSARADSASRRPAPANA
jgi:ABC-type transport system involved in cytochrome c biogenesis permease subunit